MKPVFLPDGLLLPGLAPWLDLPGTLDSGQAFRWRQLAAHLWAGPVGNRVVRIACEGQDIFFPGACREDWPLLRRYFDLARSYRRLGQLYCQDPFLKEAMAWAPGIRLLRQDPWETLCSFIISANNNIPRIKGILERLCRLYGQQLEEDFFSFPAPGRLAGLEEEELAPIRCGYRAGFLLDAARQVSSGSLSLAEVDRMPTPEARQQLMTIRGVGPKVADCVLLYGFGRVECFPMDTWMKKVSAAAYPQGLPEGLLPTAGIAQQVLFHYARHHGELLSPKGSSLPGEGSGEKEAITG